MIEIKAYQCEFCNKLFKTATHHGVCKSDPTAIHCGDCKHHFNDRECDDFGSYPAAHSCKKHMMHGNAPRKKECAEFEAIPFPEWLQ